MAGIASQSPAKPALVPGWIEEEMKSCDPQPDAYEVMLKGFSMSETLNALRDLSDMVAPGPDGCSGSLYKMAVLHSKEQELMLRIITRFCQAIYDCGGRLEGGKTSVTKCLWKKPGLKTCGNLRPIALQNSIFKLPSKILAKRLAIALKKNKAMDPAQEAFLIGGKASNAIWTLLGLYEHADMEDKDIFVVFYDWAKAYDTLPWYAVEMGMRRLGLPDQFIEYVLCSLKGSSTSYRTAYGNTSTVYMMRGVKQGDPQAPLLYHCHGYPPRCAPKERQRLRPWR